MPDMDDTPTVRIMRPVLLILVRFVAMAVCAFVLTIVVGKTMSRLLPPGSSFDDSFRRLAQAVVVGSLTGIALGGLLTHKLGRGRYPAEVRVYFAVTAALPFFIAAGLALIA